MKTFVLALLLAAPAEAGMVDATLVATRQAVAPGETFDAGLRLVHRPHWHTYWLNPGDSGISTKLMWRLPLGWKTGPAEWPAPERITIPPLTSFGYSGDIVIPVRITVPARAEPGHALLRATAEWLECADVCVPGKAELALPVEVRTRSTSDPNGTLLLATARTRMPVTQVNAVLGARLEGARILLEIQGRHPGAEFFPAEPVYEGGRGPLAVSPTRTELTLLLSPGTPAPTRLNGVLVRPGLPPVAVSMFISTKGAAARNLLLAFLGGLLLNLMPCVFPVLSMKVLGLLGRTGGSPMAARRHAAAYALGVVLSFEALATGLIIARATGAALGWGFHLQSPWIVAPLAVLFAAIGCSLLGFLEVGSRWMGIGSGLVAKEGHTGSFFSGVFAVVVAAPCTAPFMGAALGWALSRPPRETLAVFAMLGLGTAAPYTLLASWPALIKRLPRPGAWMENLKRALSVPMFATAVWLLWVLWRLVAPDATAANAAWRVWSPAAVSQSRAAGRAVFVDFTAAWCLTCQVNERAVLSRPRILAALAATDAYKADWTNRDPGIAAELAAHGRAGVPLYIVYPVGGEAVTLPEILTPNLVLEALKGKP